VIPFNPAEHFRQFNRDSKEFMKAAQGQNLSIALVYSLAEMVHRGASAEEMTGARRLIDIFLGIAEKPEAQSGMPPITLSTYEPGWGQQKKQK
jgi:hypothetical protein